MDRTFFGWQHRVFAGLLAWGSGSVVVGMGLITQRRPLLRHLGIQCAAWGSIDAGLALNGRQGARRKFAESSTSQQIITAAWRFRLIVALNAALDVGYLIGGFRLFQTARGRAERRGAGLGIIIQGAFLLVYDSVLAWRVTRLLARNS